MGGWTGTMIALEISSHASIRRMSLLVNMSHSELSCPARGTVSPNPITELGSRAQAALLANTGALVMLQAKCALHERRCYEFIGKPSFRDERARQRSETCVQGQLDRELSSRK